MRNLALAFIGVVALVGCTKETPPAADKPADAAPAAVGDKVGTGMACGGLQSVGCASDKDFCQLEAGACATTVNASGVCTVKPEICPEDFAPVCGCDGVTYSSACKAAANGANVAAEGACKTPTP